MAGNLTSRTTACRTRLPRPALVRVCTCGVACIWGSADAIPSPAGLKCGGGVRSISSSSRCACNSQRARNLFEDELPVHALRQLCEQWTCQLGEARPAVGVRQIGLPLELADQVFRQRQRGIEALLERLAALFTDERVRIVSLGKKQEADLAALRVPRAAHAEARATRPRDPPCHRRTQTQLRSRAGRCA